MANFSEKLKETVNRLTAPGTAASGAIDALNKGVNSWFNGTPSGNNNANNSKNTVSQKTLTGGGKINTKATSPSSAGNAQKYSVSDTINNISSQAAINDIRDRLEAFSKNKPADYVGSYQENIDSLAEQIANRGEFFYDPTADNMWEIYKNKFTEQGKMAAADTLGKAAAMNNGYGTSYGQTAGQQMYNQYMQQLADIVPELEQRAYDRWQDEGAELLNQLDMYQNLDDIEYGRHRDEVGDYYTDYNLLKNLIDTERGIYERDRSYDRSVYEDDRNYDYQVTQDAIANALAREQWNHQKEQDRISNERESEEWEYTKKQYEAQLAAAGDGDGAEISASALAAAKNGAKKAFDSADTEVAAAKAAVKYMSGLPEAYSIYADEIANELGYPSYSTLVELTEEMSNKTDGANKFFYWKE